MPNDQNMETCMTIILCAYIKSNNTVPNVLYNRIGKLSRVIGAAKGFNTFQKWI